MSIDRNNEENSEANPIEQTEAINEVDTNDDLIPAMGRFESLELLGIGGMARVYKAFDPPLGRSVALKFIRGDHPEFAERLLMEARSQARIEHEHVCKVYETGTVNGKPFIAMQFIKGKTLTNFIRPWLDTPDPCPGNPKAKEFGTVHQMSTGNQTHRFVELFHYLLTN